MDNEIKFRFTLNIAWQIEPVNKFVYIFNIEKNLFFTIDDVAMDIWLMIKEGRNLYEIKSNMAEKYDVEFAIIESDIDEFISELIEEGVIEYDC